MSHTLHGGLEHLQRVAELPGHPAATAGAAAFLAAKLGDLQQQRVTSVQMRLFMCEQSLALRWIQPVKQSLADHDTATSRAAGREGDHIALL